MISLQALLSVYYAEHDIQLSDIETLSFFDLAPCAEFSTLGKNIIWGHLSLIDKGSGRTLFLIYHNLCIIKDFPEVVFSYLRI